MLDASQREDTMRQARKVTMWGFLALLVGLLALSAAQPLNAQQPQRITILYDAFGARAQALEMDWGFAALVEYRRPTGAL